MAESASEAVAPEGTATAVRKGASALGGLARGVGLTLAVMIGTLGGQFIYGLIGGAGHKAATPPPRESHGATEAPAAEAPTAPPVYHAFEPLIVNFEEDGQLRFLQVTVEVMARDPKTIAAVGANTPVLRNDLLLLIGSRDMKQLLTRDGKEQLRAAALQEIRRTMAKLSPESKVEDLYFTGFVMQ